MTMDSDVTPRIKTNQTNPVVEDSHEIPRNDSPPPNMNDLEKLLSNYKLKQISNCTVGYSKIAGQIYRRSMRTGFQFNLMVVGCSGLGKSSFLNTLFHSQFPQNLKTTSVTENSYRLLENEVELNLRIIEAPKFGEKINNAKCWKKIDQYLNNCFDEQVYIESKINRSVVDNATDPLVHACLYFIQPRNDKTCLKEVDLEFLKNIHEKVNIIPVIAKADTMNSRELENHKSNLLAELQLHSINYFRFIVPDDSGWRCTDLNPIRLPDRKSIQTLIDRFPFAVAAGCETVLDDKEQIPVRSYPWGKFEVDNLAHSDTSAVRTLILSTHMHELIRETHNVVYENQRMQRLANLCDDLTIDSENEYHPSMYLEKYFKLLNVSLSKKINEMESEFQDLVGKRQMALQKRAKELEDISFDLSNEMNQALLEFDCDFKRFIVDKTQWDCDNIDYHETYGTLKITRNGRLKTISKLRK